MCFPTARLTANASYHGFGLVNTLNNEAIPQTDKLVILSLPMVLYPPNRAVIDPNTQQENPKARCLGHLHDFSENLIYTFEINFK